MLIAGFIVALGLAVADVSHVYDETTKSTTITTSSFYINKWCYGAFQVRFRGKDVPKDAKVKLVFVNPREEGNPINLGEARQIRVWLGDQWAEIDRVDHDSDYRNATIIEYGFYLIDDEDLKMLVAPGAQLKVSWAREVSVPESVVRDLEQVAKTLGRQPATRPTTQPAMERDSGPR